MTTLAAGNSAVFTIDAGQSLTISSSANVEGYIIIAPTVPNDVSDTGRFPIGPPAMSKTFGPYASPVAATVACTVGSLTYTLNGSPIVRATTDAVTGVITYYPAAGGVPRGFPIILAQSAIPMILPSSGTMGANGSLTGLTALPYSVFPQPCFMYFPAGKVFSGSPAGMYYASITAATTATVYNNMYSSGRPQDAIPAVPTAVVDAGPGAYTQTTAADIQIAAITLPGGMLGPSGMLRMTQTGTTSAGTAANRTIKAKFGSVSIMSWLISAATKSSTHSSQTIANRNSVASQVCPDAYGGYAGYAGSASQYSAINTAADVTLSYSASLVTADANQILEAFVIEVLPG